MTSQEECCFDRCEIQTCIEKHNITLLIVILIITVTETRGISETGAQIDLTLFDQSVTCTDCRLLV